MKARERYKKYVRQKHIPFSVEGLQCKEAFVAI